MHSWPTLGALIADDDHVTRINPGFVKDPVAGRILALEHSCRTREGEDRWVNARRLYDAAVDGDVAEQDRKAAVLEVRLLAGADASAGAVGVQGIPAGALAEGGLRGDAGGPGAEKLGDFLRGIAHDVPLVKRCSHGFAVNGR